MRISLKKFFVTAGFGLVVGCTPGTGGDAGTCELDTDCPGTEQCHPTLLVCEAECVADTDCSGDRPQCNVSDEEGTYILEVDGIRDLCICTADSCGAGEVCSAETGLCEAGDEPEGCEANADCEADEVCDTGTGDCLCATVGDERADGTVCEGSGEWGQPCADDDCFAEGGLCQFDDADPEFNLCVEAEEITATCAAAANADAVAGADDIVIYDVERILETADACGQNGTLAISVYLASVYSEEDLGAADAQDILFRPGFTAGGEKFFENADNVTEVEGLGGDFPNEYIFTFHICGDPGADVAAQVQTAANVSNAFCFDPQMTIAP